MRKKILMIAVFSVMGVGMAVAQDEFDSEIPGFGRPGFGRPEVPRIPDVQRPGRDMRIMPERPGRPGMPRIPERGRGLQFVELPS